MKTLYEYKVLSQKDGLLSAKFSPAQLESSLNAQGSLGWRLITSVTAEVPAIMTGKREEILFIMERAKNIPQADN
jgi:hypothetical protein